MLSINGKPQIGLVASDRFYNHLVTLVKIHSLFLFGQLKYRSSFSFLLDHHAVHTADCFIN